MKVVHISIVKICMIQDGWEQQYAILTFLVNKLQQTNNKQQVNQFKMLAVNYDTKIHSQITNINHCCY